MRKSNELVTLFMEGSLFNLMANYLKEELKGKGGEILCTAGLAELVCLV